MELGGNAPFIVFDDADLDQAVAGVMLSKYRNAGQTCVCSNRILVQADIYDAFAEKLTASVNKLKIGSGMDESVTIGPLVDDDAAEGVRALIRDAVSLGASASAGGATSALGGSFVEPTVLLNVDSRMRVFREEIFGPVAPLIKFETEDQALSMANDSEFGLAAYVYTRDFSRLWRVSEGLEYGMVGVNEGAISNEMAPFGGVKQSGSGREGSKYGLEDYLDIKYLCLGGIA
jgi:succinate-semialdehyde dehydrogenase/glutarate-semialdehyde dehydrogenase